jgi:predicted Zn finger-like uncharacterized protein
MPIRTACPGCRQTYLLHDEQIGKTVRCKHCSTAFLVERPAATLNVKPLPPVEVIEPPSVKQAIPAGDPEPDGYNAVLRRVPASRRRRRKRSGGAAVALALLACGLALMLLIGAGVVVAVALYFSKATTPLAAAPRPTVNRASDPAPEPQATTPAPPKPDAPIAPTPDIGQPVFTEPTKLEARFHRLKGGMTAAQVRTIMGPPSEENDDTPLWKGKQLKVDGQLITVVTAGRMKWIEANSECHVILWNEIAQKTNGIVGIFNMEEGGYSCYGTNADYDESQGQLSNLTDKDTDSMGLGTSEHSLINHPKGPPTGRRWGLLKTPKGKSAFLVLTWKSSSGPGYFKAYIGYDVKQLPVVVDTEKKDLPAGP